MTYLLNITTQSNTPRGMIQKSVAHSIRFVYLIFISFFANCYLSQERCNRRRRRLVSARSLTWRARLPSFFSLGHFHFLAMTPHYRSGPVWPYGEGYTNKKKVVRKCEGSESRLFTLQRSCSRLIRKDEISAFVWFSAWILRFLEQRRKKREQCESFVLKSC